MAINPNIPLQVRTPDISQGIGMLTRAVENKRQREAEQPLRDLQMQQAQAQLNALKESAAGKQAARDMLVMQMFANANQYDALDDYLVNIRKPQIEGRGAHTIQTDQIREILANDPETAKQMINQGVNMYTRLGLIEPLDTSGTNVAQKTDLINGVLAVGLDDSGQTFAIEVGTNERLVGPAAIERIQSEMKAERAAELKAKKDEADVRVKEAREKAIATDAISAAGEAFDQIPKIDTNIANLQEAVRLVGDGANTGPIVSMFPSIQQASIELDNLQGRLGLDVVGATTFGALSKGELDLAKNVALPKRLKGPELVEWANKKIEAQKKLRNYLREMAVFLQQGGSRAEWANHIKARKEAGNPVGQATIRIQYDAQGNRIQ